MLSRGGDEGVTPLHYFGHDSTLPVIPLDVDSSTYLTCVGARAAFVAPDDGARGAAHPMQFLPALENAQRVTAVGFSEERCLLALCVAPLRRPPPTAAAAAAAACAAATRAGGDSDDEALEASADEASSHKVGRRCVVYKLGRHAKRWVASVAAVLDIDDMRVGDDDAYRCVAFSKGGRAAAPGAAGGDVGGVVVCVATSNDAHKSFAVGFDWASGETLFAAAVGGGVRSACFHPRNASEMSTAGRSVQLWRLVDGELKQRALAQRRGREAAVEGFCAHAWLEPDQAAAFVEPGAFIAAGTFGGAVVVVQHGEETQRFEAHASKKAVLCVAPFSSGGKGGKGGAAFLTACQGGTICVFEAKAVPAKATDTVVRQFFLRATLAMPAASGPASPLRRVTAFPQSATLLCTYDGGLWAYDVDAELDARRTADAGAEARTGASALEGDSARAPAAAGSTAGARLGRALSAPFPVARSIALANAKRLVATAGADGVTLWNWGRCGVAARLEISAAAAAPAYELAAEDARCIICLDAHPSGHEVIVGFEFELRLYDVGLRSLVEARRVALKGVVTLKKDATPLVNVAPLTTLHFSRAGALVAAVCGKLILVYATRSPAQGDGGRLALIHALRGHAANVTAVAWGADDQGLWTCSEDGAVYEWAIGALADRGKIVLRVRDVVLPHVRWRAVAVFGETGCVVAAGSTFGARGAGKQRRRSDPPVGPAPPPAGAALLQRGIFSVPRAMAATAPVLRQAASQSRLAQKPAAAGAPGVVCIWPSWSDAAPPLEVSVAAQVTCVVALDALVGAPSSGAVVCGTQRGTLLYFRAATLGLGPDTSAACPPFEAAACAGRVVALRHAVDGDHVFAAGSDGGVVVLRASRSFGLDADSLTVAAKYPLAYAAPSCELRLRDARASNEDEDDDDDARAEAAATAAQRDDFVLADRSALLSLEEAVTAAELRARETADASRERLAQLQPALDRELDDVRSAAAKQVAAALHKLAKAERDAAAAAEQHAAEFDVARLEFETEFVALETLYDRKVAVEAARYMSVRDDFDRAEQDLRELRGAAEEREGALVSGGAGDLAALGAARDRDVADARAYAEHARKQFDAVLDDEETRHDVEVSSAAQANARALAAAQAKQTAAVRAKARLTRANVQLEDEHAIIKHTLIERSSAFEVSEFKAKAAAEAAEAHAAACAVAAARADGLAATLVGLEQQLDEVSRFSAVVDEQKKQLAQDVSDERARLAGARSQAKKLDGLLDDAGRAGNQLAASLSRTRSEASALTVATKDASAAAAAAARRLGRVVEQFDVFLDGLRAPQRRPCDAVMRELQQLREAIAALETKRAGNDARFSVSRSGARPASPAAGPADASDRAPPRVDARSQRLAAANCHAPDRAKAATIDKMRAQNSELLAELNHLRYDRTALYRKLRDAQFQLDFGQATARPSSPFAARAPLPALFSAMEADRDAGRGAL